MDTTERTAGKARSLPKLRRIVEIEAGPARPLPVVHLAGTPLHAITEAQVVEYIVSSLETGRGGWVVTPNLDHVRRLEKDPSFAELCRGASLCVADGMPLVWACALQGTPLPERVAGSNLISSLSARAADVGRSIFLLGGEPGTADAAAKVLRTRHPRIRVVGTFCPPVGFESDDALMAEMTDRMTTSAPDIVFVALGSPKQERLIETMRQVLPHAWWLGVGISFSFLCGDVKRAPVWLQKIGLEWTHRLAQEPRRLARRYLMDGLPFAARLLASSAWKRRRAPKSNT